MTGSAFLGMYDMPWQQAANDRLWQAIRMALESGPAELERGRDPWDIWRAPDLVLAQTCSLPYRSALHSQTALVGTPDYGLDDCQPGHYRSVIVTRRAGELNRVSHLHGLIMAVNDARSQSGWAAPYGLLSEKHCMPEAVIVTGSHAASIKAVATGLADFAGIDLHSWNLLQGHDPHAEALRVIAQTAESPGLPLITSQQNDPSAIFDAVCTAIDGLSDEDRALLGLKALLPLPKAAYLDLAIPPAPTDTSALVKQI